MTWRTPTASAIKAAIGAVDVIVRSTPWDFVSTWLWPLRTRTADVHRQRRDHRRGSLEQRQAPFGAAWLLGALDAGHVIPWSAISCFEHFGNRCHDRQYGFLE